MATPRSDLIPDPLPHGSFDNLPDLDALNELTARPHWVAWKAVPQPGKKPRKLPIAARTGMAASSTDPATWSDYRAAVERAKRSRLAGVGYVVSDDDDLTAIDLDDCIDEDSGDPLPWAADILAHAETYAEISPSGLGIRMWVRGKIDRAVKRSDVELYARARYLTVTGWHIPGTPETINEAPHTLAALVERVEEQKPVPAPSKAMPSPSAQTTTDELSDLLSYISPDVGYHDWINVLMAIHAETGGSASGFAMADQWSSRGSKYVNSKDVHQHWRSFRGQGVSMGTLAKMARDGGADLAEIAIRHKPRTELDAEALAAVAAIIRHPDGTLTDADGVVIEPTASQTFDATYPPGLVGDIARWIVATATRPQPLLSIGAALSIVGTVAGGSYVGPTRAATHLYILNIAPTGMGKDVPLRAIRTIMKACQLACRVGPDEFTSMPAVVSLLHRAPVNVCPMDEFGSFLKRINSKRASGFEGAVSKIFRTAWGCNFTDMVTPEYAQKASEVIHSPGMSIVGATTAEEFYQSIAAGDSSNGVLNRFLLLESPDRPARTTPSANPFVPPASIVDGLKRIYQEGAQLPGEADPDPYFEGIAANPVRWESPAAERVYLAILDRVEGMVEAENNDASFFARTGEMAARIATIVAVGRGSSTVSVHDMEWAASLAWWSAESMLRGVREHASENDHQANYKLVRGIVEKAGEISRSDLLRRIQGRVDARTLDGIIKTLLESRELLLVTDATSAKGGRPKTFYRRA
jgi:hypothetical protein